MNILCLAFLALACIELTTAQFFGFSGFGCGTVPTVGGQCHMGSQNNTVFCTATGSSVFRHAPYYGDYKAYLAVDGHLSPGNAGFYHSSLESYPWLKIELKDRTYNATQMDVSRVNFYLRCDVSEWYHPGSYEIRGTSDPGKPETRIWATPRLIGGKVCGTQTQFGHQSVIIRQGNMFTVGCTPTITAAKEIWIQKITDNSHGAGWPNYNGNRWNSWTENAHAKNSNWPVSFLMINEVVLY